MGLELFEKDEINILDFKAPEKISPHKKSKRQLLRTTIPFILTFAICTLIIVTSIYNRLNVEKLTMEQLIIEKSTKASEVLSRLLYKTQTLATLVLQNGGEIENFDRIAATIIDDPSILNVLIAPDGIVTNVFPTAGNEAVLGLDFFSEGAGNKEAVLARDTGQLVLGGPFSAVQGGEIIVGRLPVYISDIDDKKSFWGIVSITMKYPQVLDVCGFNELQFQGFAYEIWRINPDNGEKQIITGSDYQYNKNVRYIEKKAEIQNAEWYFRILPVRGWYEYPDTWIMVILGICVSLLVAFVTKNNSELKELKTGFERLSHMDALTNIYNRRYFMEIAPTYVERSKRIDGEAYIIIFDLDFFKNINDTFGHLAGDEVLKETVSRVKEIIRPYDLLSRFGGEEFILLAADICQRDAQNLAERLRLKIADKPVIYEGHEIMLTASFGASRTSSAESFMKDLDSADKALYTAKHEGRNKVVFSHHDA